MARKRKLDEGNGVGVAFADPLLAEQVATTTGDSTVTPANRPAASFMAHSDRTTRIEVAVWTRQVTAGEGEEYTQYSLTVNRSWRDKEGQWTENGFYRAHDVPVLLYLVQRSYEWCLAQRTRVRDETESTP